MTMMTPSSVLLNLRSCARQKLKNPNKKKKSGGNRQKVRMHAVGTGLLYSAKMSPGKHKISKTRRIRSASKVVRYLGSKKCS
jgi:hypothetical protein